MPPLAVLALTASLLSVVAAHAESTMVPSARAVVTMGSAGPALTYVVLGDSTAAGEGGIYESGIAMGTTRALSRRFHVSMFNISVSGAKIGDVRANQLAGAEALHADVVLLAAGANDVTHLTSIRGMRRDLQGIVQGLTASNRNVKIVITGSPDMGAPPRVPWILRGLASYRTKRTNRMFERAAVAMGLTFAPIAARTGPIFRRDHSLFAADNFHPNERGYAAWIPVLDEALDAALSSR